MNFTLLAQKAHLSPYSAAFISCIKRRESMATIPHKPIIARQLTIMPALHVNLDMKVLAMIQFWCITKAHKQFMAVLGESPAITILNVS